MNETFTKKDLVRLTKEPFDMQHDRMLAKVMEAISYTRGDILLCFSGGKDSALLLDVYCEVIRMFGMTHIPVKVAWANTTNETKAMREYVPFFIKRCEQKYGVKVDFNEVKPKEGQNIVSVIKQEGLPFISKSVASILRKVTKDMENAGVTYDDIKGLHTPTIQSRDTLREMGMSDTTVLSLTGWSCKRNDFGKDFVLAKQWMPLLDIKRVTGKNIFFSEMCCTILKKEPISRLDYPNIMTGEQAVESKKRESSWLNTGCNYSLPDGSFHSKPLGSLSLDSVLYSIKTREVPICSDYGEVVKCTNLKNRCYCCTKAQRTGCALCGFGIKFDTERFVRLQETEPAKVAFAFKPIDQGGLGYKEVCEYSNEYCGTKIVIPDV